MKLLMALVATSTMLAVAVAGYSLITSNARVVQKFDQARLLNETRFRVKEAVACRASHRAICGGKTAALVWKGVAPELGPVAFLRKGQPLAKFQESTLVLSADCIGTSLGIDYLHVKQGKAAIDPVSRQETGWRPLFRTPLCAGGEMATRWPE